MNEVRVCRLLRGKMRSAASVALDMELHTKIGVEALRKTLDRLVQRGVLGSVFYDPVLMYYIRKMPPESLYQSEPFNDNIPY